MTLESMHEIMSKIHHLTDDHRIINYYHSYQSNYYSYYWYCCYRNLESM